MINLTRLRKEKSYKLENHSGNYMSSTVRLSPEESQNRHHASKTYIQSKTSNRAPFSRSYAYKKESKKIVVPEFKPQLRNI
jgi:hypothetical protein